jgi:hypothetical protein
METISRYGFQAFLQSVLAIYLDIFIVVLISIIFISLLTPSPRHVTYNRCAGIDVFRMSPNKSTGWS